jgi:adenosine deaminase
MTTRAHGPTGPQSPIPDPRPLDYYDLLPKIELHLHLEGAIPYDALWQLVQKYGGDPTIPTLAALDQRFQYRDFPHFLETWVWKNNFLREPEDFTFIAAAVARDLASQNIRYVEAFYSPPDFARHGLTPQEMTVALRRGLDQVPDIEVTLVADLVRDSGPRRAARTLAAVAEVRDHGVAGIGLGGAEHAYPPEPFAAVYEQARALGFRTSVHAGEAAGPESIWGAIRALRPDRIGHATRAEEDPALLDYLAAQQIPLEMCPLSNVRTGVVPTIEAHPIRRYFQRGIPVTANTDDPRMFGNSLAEEYRQLETALGFTAANIHQLIHTAVSVSWLPPERQAALAAALRASPGWQE